MPADRVGMPCVICLARWTNTQRLCGTFGGQRLRQEIAARCHDGHMVVWSVGSVTIRVTGRHASKEPAVRANRTTTPRV